MQINNISKSCQTRSFNTFTGNEISASKNKPARYKHYEQMSDENLMARSIIKAHKKVQKSGKMQLLNAMPTITTALIGTSIAIAQPGKLASKAAAGLGFLVATKVCGDTLDTVSKVIDKKFEKKPLNNETQKQKTLTKIASYTASAFGIVGGALLLAKAATKTINKIAKPVGNFLANEAQKLSSEINNSKLGKFTEEKINPYLQVHPKAARNLSTLVPLGIIAAGTCTMAGLQEDLSNNFRKEANKNFVKGKLIQEIARKEFDKIPAKEV